MRSYVDRRLADGNQHYGPTRFSRGNPIPPEPGVRAVGFGMDMFLPGYYLRTYIIEGPKG